MAMILQAIVDRIEGAKIVLIFLDGQRLIVDKNIFPKGLKEGQSVGLTLKPDTNKSQKIVVSKLLKEILRKNQDEGQGKFEKN